MRAAIRRAAAGERTRLPSRVMFHIVAATYGTTPAAVRAWPADDFLDAVAFLQLTAPSGGRRP